MTNKTHSTTYNPLGNITVTGGGYTLGAGYSSANAIYVGGGAGGGTGISAHTSWATTASTMQPSSLQVSGDAEFLGNIKIKGRDLTDWLATVDSRLATVDSRLGILHINSELESEFDELRALGDAYREAERRFIEQKRVYDILKNTDE
jgi:hypothetical protein